MGILGKISAEEASQSDAGRQAERADVHLCATLRRREGKPARVDILDLSTHGFRAETTGNFHAGNQVWLKLPGLEAILATVAWADHIQIGCSFEKPLHPAVHARIVSQGASGGF
jgi:hypothetical protein